MLIFISVFFLDYFQENCCYNFLSYFQDQWRKIWPKPEMVCFFRNPTNAHYFIVMIFFYAKRKSLIIESCLVATETFVLMEIFSLTVNCCLPKTGKLSLSNERKSCPLSPCEFLKLFIRIAVFKCFSIDLQVIFPFHQMHYVVRALVRHTST